MSEHPIQGLMKTAMESIKDMVDVNTIVGDAVETGDGTVIIPISRVSFGFAAGGANCEPSNEESQATSFGGGSGAGVSVKPVGFLVCSPVSGVRFMPVEGNLVYDRVMDLVPKILNTIQDLLDGKRKDDLDELAKTAETQSNEI
ncbi:GerW family sporulation protein [Pelosinus sp. sgz500959]|uniref:GerW family sporulation protein n=1 Tax=Pelosinus sp. sgz500959 TaxID=3242472 RepID=UPI00366C81B9